MVYTRVPERVTSILGTLVYNIYYMILCNLIFGKTVSIFCFLYEKYVSSKYDQSNIILFFMCYYCYMYSFRYKYLSATQNNLCFPRQVRTHLFTALHAAL